jgi:hypothetical protein
MNSHYDALTFEAYFAKVNDVTGNYNLLAFVGLIIYIYNCYHNMS